MGVIEQKRILCFGDSLTWGWNPVVDGVPVNRYPKAIRWTGVLADELGSGFEIIEEGLSGRTTNLDDPLDSRLNGSNYLPSALASHLPLDLVVLMLGTNDTKSYFNRSSSDIAIGMAYLVGQVAKSAGGVGTAYSAPQTLIIAPPPIQRIDIDWFKIEFSGAEQKTKELAEKYRALSEISGSHFLNAGEIICTNGVDGIHFSEQNNLDLGKAVAEKIKQIFQ